MSRRSGLILLLVIALIVGAGVVRHFTWRTPQTVIPIIATEGMDAEVARAIDQARAEVERAPDSGAAWGRWGMVLFAQNMYGDCVGILTEAERLDPNDIRWPYFRGLALLLNKPEDGIALLEKVANRRYSPLSVRLRLAEEYLKIQRIEQADALFRSLSQDEPNNPRVLLGRGQILMRQGNPTEALSWLQRASQHPSAKHTAHTALAECYGRLGDDAAAEKERQMASEVTADADWPDPILDEARALKTGLQPRIDGVLELLGAGKVREASEFLTQVLADHPNSAEARLTMGKVLIHANRFAEASRELGRAIELNPNLIEGHFLLGGIQFQNKDYPAAESSYRRAAELKPAYGQAHYLLGESLLKQEKKTKAIEAFRNAVRCRPDLVSPHVELGALYLEEGQIDAAVRSLENALQLDKGNERAKKLLAMARSRRSP